MVKAGRPMLCGALCALAIVFTVTVASAALVGTPFSDWAWISPQPQGGNLDAIAFAGGRGYAVGPLGTVLVTGDGGATWTALHAVVVGGGCDLRRSDDGGATFYRLPFDGGDAGCASPVAAVAFPSPTVGYVALADGTLLRTADGGQTFTRAGSVASPDAAFFTTPDIGFVGGPQGLYETVNDGTSFKQVLDADVADVDFPSAEVGYAVGPGTFYATSDGGATWTSRNLSELGADAAFTTVRCATVTLCLLVSDNAGHTAIVRTPDGGLTFTAQDIGGGETVDAVDFASSGRAVAVGAAGHVVASNDGGLTFTTEGSSLPGTVIDLWSSPTGVYADGGGGGTLSHSGDGGATWTSIDVPTTAPILSVSFPTAQTGYALDEAGNLFKSPNGGAGWIALAAGSPAPVALYAPSADRLVLAGSVGLRLSVDGGETFSTLTGPAARARVTALAAAGAGAIAAWGPHVLLRSENDGTSWTSLRLPQTHTDVLQVDLLGGGEGYLLDAEHRLWATTDSGRGWRELAGLGTGAVQSIAFDSMHLGFASVSGYAGLGGGWVLQTSDGGTTWRPERLGPEPLVLVAPGTAGSGAYALAEGAEAFATTDTGAVGTPTSLTLRSPRATAGRRTVVVAGRLNGGPVGAGVNVAWRAAHSLAWHTVGASVGAGGSFTVDVPAGAGAAVVVSYPGSGVTAGSGSPAFTVAEPQRHRR